MSKCFIEGVGAGGGGLNYTVIGGTVEPTNPKNNTIWVQTENEITSYYIGAVAPNNPEEGCVWISTWTKSAQAFNALKKNALIVYPNYCKQYIGGEWVSKEILVRFGTEWVSATRYLLTAGNPARPFALQSGRGASSGRGDGYIYAKGTESYFTNPCDFYFMYPDLVDLSAFSTVNAEAYAVKEGYGGSGSLVVCTSLTGGIAASVALGNSYSTKSLNISALEGEYYIGFYGSPHRWAITGSQGADGGHIYAKNLWLEP